VFFGGRLGIADETVRPEVGDVDLDGVVTGVEEGVDASGPGFQPLVMLRVISRPNASAVLRA
jgi:hypothetical protein